LAGTWL